VRRVCHRSLPEFKLPIIGNLPIPSLGDATASPYRSRFEYYGLGHNTGDLISAAVAAEITDPVLISSAVALEITDP
jgi:hypothetical protein